MPNMLNRLFVDHRGMAAVEFAMVTPFFCALMVGAVDLGGELFTKFRLDAAVEAGANYAEVNALNVNSSNGQTVANNTATVVETSQGSAWANATVVVNNGPTATVTGGTSTPSGTVANADSCYCPTGTAGSLTWGSAVACGSACPGNNTGYAGRFVTITASKTYSPIFSSYGLVTNGTISTTALVEVAVQ